MKKSKYGMSPVNASVCEYDAAAERAGNVIGERIAAARKKNGMSQRCFSEMLLHYGVTISKAAESKWETGETVPNAYQLMAVCAALGINEQVVYFSRQYTMLLNEEGEKKVAEYRADLIASGKYRPNPNHGIRYRDMPISNLRVSAGTGSFLDDGGFDMVRFPENSIADGADFGVRVSGDSMEPVYHDGQIVWVRECTTLLHGDVGIFIYDGDGYIKSYAELEPPAESKYEYTDSYGVVHPQPMLISFNQLYSPIIISPDAEFRIVGKVI